MARALTHHVAQVRQRPRRADVEARVFVHARALAPQPLGDRLRLPSLLVTQMVTFGDGPEIFRWDSNPGSNRGWPIIRNVTHIMVCLLYTSPSPRDQRGSRMPSSA